MVLLTNATTLQSFRPPSPAGPLPDTGVPPEHRLTPDFRQDHRLTPDFYSIESELLNMDLRFFGGKSLPEHSAAKKSLYIHGPKVLQA
ncbi:hypothetical protein MA16_Dca002062 [Dendrobium catenatum]|uniref:Uncharacterized protein n=1 Tax=Dendrobium catenatum TaxID=906689 RepID=A0A2I0XE87_9ASPA|nr:hypothetical protein MA16_Dca002062 [Dendrobium catenatum]